MDNPEKKPDKPGQKPRAKGFISSMLEAQAEAEGQPSQNPPAKGSKLEPQAETKTPPSQKPPAKGFISSMLEAQAKATAPKAQNPPAKGFINSKLEAEAEASVPHSENPSAKGFISSKLEEEEEAIAPPTKTQPPRRHRLAIVLGSLVLLVVVFYAEEYWRGKSAWQDVKTNLGKQQEVLDWAALLPPPVPDNQNFFKSPKMQEWFTGSGSNALTARLSTRSFLEGSRQASQRRAPALVAELILRPPDSVEADNEKAQDPKVENIVLTIIANAIGRLAETPEGFPISANSFAQNGPVHLSITPDSIPPDGALARLAPTNVQVRTEHVGGFRVQIILDPAPVAAGDYLAWSRQFQPELDQLREAVKRPVARFDGDYRQLRELPVINLPAVGSIANLMGDRAECHLMTGDPEAALADLTLLRDFTDCLTGKPSGKPISLAAAEANLVPSEIFVAQVANGLRWQVWREPQLAALQDELGRMDLIKLAWTALESERAGTCEMLRTAPRSESASKLGLNDKRKTLIFKFMPKGWIYQNMAVVANLDQNAIDAVRDLNQGVIRPGIFRSGWEQMTAALRQTARYSFAAKNAITSDRGFLEATARVQAMVAEATVACALERYYFAKGTYPEKLDALLPRFLPLLPVDPVTGESLHYKSGARGRFLLYSVGWDEKDDLGSPANASGKGDWVWGRL